MQTEFFHGTIKGIPHIVIREQPHIGRPKHTMFRLDGKSALKCPADLARKISAARTNGVTPTKASFVRLSGPRDRARPDGSKG